MKKVHCDSEATNGMMDEFLLVLFAAVRYSDFGDVRYGASITTGTYIDTIDTSLLPGLDKEPENRIKEVLRARF